MNTHAQCPVPLRLEDRLRVYFTSRPDPRSTQIGFLDCDPSNPTRVIEINPDPLLPLGGVGTFDEFAVMGFSAIRRDGAVFLYYTGGSRPASVPYLSAIGLAISEDDGRTFRRYATGPIVERRLHEPYSAMAPWVMEVGGVWHMWYGSGKSWKKGPDRYEPIYVIRHAVSDDGIHWEQNGNDVIPQAHPEEAQTRPCVVKMGDEYHMWFSSRASDDFRGGKGSYRMCYARSVDLAKWERDDSLSGIDHGAPGEWDSEMTAYPCVWQEGDELRMFYNGNGFGVAGFGYASCSASKWAALE